jgi:WD40 repeat protein
MLLQETYKGEGMMLLKNIAHVKDVKMKYHIVVLILAIYSVEAWSLSGNAQDIAYNEVVAMDFPGVTDIAWSPDGSQLAIVYKGFIDIVDSKLWELTLKLASPVGSHIVWKLDGTQLASVSGGNPSSLYVWNSASGDIIQHLAVHFDGIEGGVFPMYELSWSPEGSFIVSDSYGTDVLLWNLDTEEITVIGSHEWGRVGSLDWNRESDRVASAGYDGTLHIWDVESGHSTLELQGFQVTEWHPYDSKILTITQDETVGIFDSETGEELLSLEHNSRVLLASWNFNGAFIAIECLDGTTNIWNAETGEKILVMEVSSNFAIASSWHPMQNLLAIADYEGMVHVLDLSSLR